MKFTKEQFEHSSHFNKELERKYQEAIANFTKQLAHEKDYLIYKYRQENPDVPISDITIICGRLSDYSAFGYSIGRTSELVTVEKASDYEKRIKELQDRIKELEISIKQLEPEF